ncbi:MAG TPA: alpha/beta fold hydrolase [Thermoanaerobaculaceae bacterium]|nr:alpha/beta fold hydrolase [Thermoanaerobaculaceae bacterium]
MIAGVVLQGALAPAVLAATPSERAVSFPSLNAAGVVLEGMVAVPPAGAAVAGVVICHPNPLAGGTMDNEIVKDLRAAFSRAGVATLRFNFRGVGRSTGSFGAGTDEVSDVLGALEFLRQHGGVDPAHVSVVGYSFGARVGLEGAVRDGKVVAVACLGFPARDQDDVSRSAYFKGINFPTMFVAGTEDTVCRFGVLEDIVRTYGVGTLCRLEPIQGADHYLREVGQRGIAVKRIVRFVTGIAAHPLASSPP